MPYECVCFLALGDASDVAQVGLSLHTLTTVVHSHGIYSYFPPLGAEVRTRPAPPTNPGMAGASSVAFKKATAVSSSNWLKKMRSAVAQQSRSQISLELVTYRLFAQQSCSRIWARSVWSERVRQLDDPDPETPQSPV